MKVFEELGRAALGTRVRFMGETITANATKIYNLYGIEMNPKWFPVFYILSNDRERTITSIAGDIGQSHVSVIKIVSEMSKAGLVTERTSTEDRRRTLVMLSKAGKKFSEKIQNQYIDVKAAIEELSSQSRHDLWEALDEWEYLLLQKSLIQRVVDHKKRRESGGVRIVPYQAKYRSAFRKLNTEWITTYFKMEKADRDALDHPEEYILDRGGFIFVALMDDEPVGVCALLKRNDQKYPYELAKMAVSPKARGKGVGWLLGKAVVEKTKSLKARVLYVESNTVLKPAISLYEKMGFKKVIGPSTPYERCNIQMELKL